MEFCTAVTCMDGRIQLPVIKYLQEKYSAKYIDTITEAGPNLILYNQEEDILIQSILQRLEISINVHKSSVVAVVGHYDCAKNQGSKEVQVIHTKKAMDFIRGHYKNIELIGLWVDDNWEVSEI